MTDAAPEPACSAAAPPSVDPASQKRRHSNSHPDSNKKPRVAKNKKKSRPPKPPKEGSAEEILKVDIDNLLSSHPAATKETTLPELFSFLELNILELSSTGDGLALHEGRVYVVPFSIPGDTVESKVVRHTPTHTATDFVRVVRPGPERDDSLIGCKYFNTCSGCQLQMLPYAAQLKHKRRVIEKAYANFSSISNTLLPEIGETIGSPLQYGYRTKLTPHFDGPRKGGFDLKRPPPEIGFQVKGRRQVLDIEDCPIGTGAVREGLKRQRKYVHENLHTYKKGATLLLRESTKRTPKEPAESASTTADGLSSYIEEKLCITSGTETSTEYIGNYRFDNPAGSFFQNNNSILVPFTDFIRSKLSLPVSSSSSETATPKYLVDAYCGSGLFTVTCGRDLLRCDGVDISSQSIDFARRNGEANNIKNTRFVEGNAEKIFEKVDFPGEETSMIIDPPRKGCDQLFLDQLLDFGPRRIVYVSCNVHTQARDLGYILKSEKGKGYKVDEIRGFDFFPQTHHVESVAVLTKVE